MIETLEPVPSIFQMISAAVAPPVRTIVVLESEKLPVTLMIYFAPALPLSLNVMVPFVRLTLLTLRTFSLKLVSALSVTVDPL